MTQEYNNTLDIWYSNCHWAIQEVLRSPYLQISEWLVYVTGDPNKVAGKGPTYEAIARQVGQLATEVQTAASEVDGWEGEASNGFRARMGELSGAFEQLAPAVAQTNQILRAAAETSVETANMILDIVKSVIDFLIGSLAVSAALAVFTFGASFAGWIAANLANGARAVAQISSGLARVAQVLQRIASMLDRIADLLRTITKILKEIKELLKLLKELKKHAGLVGKGVITGVTALVRMPVKLAANGALNGVEAVTGADINMPAGVGSAIDGLHNGADAVGASDRAVDAATGAP